MVMKVAKSIPIDEKTLILFNEAKSKVIKKFPKARHLSDNIIMYNILERFLEVEGNGE